MLPTYHDTIRRKRILCIDDDESVLLSIRMLLEHFGYDVAVFHDHRQAVDAFQTDPLKFDLVIVDQFMPGKTGLELAKEMRLLQSDIPIAMTSGYFDSLLDSEAEQCCVDALIDKPIDVTDFIAIVRSLLENAKRTQE